MKKKASSPDYHNDPNSELIVMVNPETNFRSNKNNLSSIAGADTSNFNKVLKKYKARITPIFGAEARISSMPQKSRSFLANYGVHLESYYFVQCDSKKGDLCAALAKDPNVITAYIKPPSEIATMVDDLQVPTNFDAPPVTPNFTGQQGYLDPAPGGIDAKYAWTKSGGKGNNVAVIDIEGAWRFSHEDLGINQGGVIAGTQSTDLRWRDHGTAVAGEISGDDNAIGITGISPRSNISAASFFGIGTASAIRTAADSLSTGDIILLELHRPGPQFNFAQRDDQRGYIAIEWWPDDFAAVLYAHTQGVIVVGAAGNGAENLDAAIYNTRPASFPATWRNPFNMSNPISNSVIVGAGAPPSGNFGADRSRLGFSNFGARVDAQGWGREVVTTGYGDLQGGSDEDLWYTRRFSGTSSASPIVVGALACTQGRLKARSKPLLTAITARALLRRTGSPQQNGPNGNTTQRIGNRPDLKDIFNDLNIDGGKLIFKDRKDILKDRKEIKEKNRKEFIKDRKEFKEKDFKEFKEKERKEFKEKEGKEFKEKDRKEFEKNNFENQGQFKQPDLEQYEHYDYPTDSSRLDALESKIEALYHFISSDLRPDLEKNMYEEDEVSQDDMDKYLKDNNQQ